eukprot:jgi/Chrzof1/5895/Cz16g19210.t1
MHTCTLPSERVLKNLMPHALHKMGLPLGPFLHCGLDVAAQWQQGPDSSCLVLRRMTAGEELLLGAKHDVRGFLRGTEANTVHTPVG